MSRILLWTIQNFPVYEQLQSTGRFFADKKYPAVDFCFQHAYDWMAGKMIERNIVPVRHDSRPLWAWYQWEGKRKRRDLRCKGYAERGRRMVQLAIEIEDSEVLLSDFDAYHYVLYRQYLPADEVDAQNFENECEAAGVKLRNLYAAAATDKSGRIGDKILRSWNRIFDLTNENIIYGRNDKKSIQATFWEIRREQVVGAEVFIAK